MQTNALRKSAPQRGIAVLSLLAAYAVIVEIQKQRQPLDACVVTASILSTAALSPIIDREEWTLTFLGDIMMSSQPQDFAAEAHNETGWTMGESLDALLPVRGDYIVGNLEGTITEAALLSYDPNNRYFSSFAMPPEIAPILKHKLKLDVANLGNNHISDRNTRGLLDTLAYLDMVNISHFGAGLDETTAAAPHVFKTPFGQTIGITSFLKDTCCSKLVSMIKTTNTTNSTISGKKGLFTSTNQQRQGSQQHLKVVRPVLDIIEEHAQLGVQLQNEANVDIKIAFVHWGQNYRRVQQQVRGSYAPMLAKAGYDLIIGSSGSHTVQPFDFVDRVPVLFDVGNFVFEKPTRFQVNYDGETSLPYGSVAHVVFDRDGPVRLEIRCTLVDHLRVNYRPRYCNEDESIELFSKVLGKSAKYSRGDPYATIELRVRYGSG